MKKWIDYLASRKNLSLLIIVIYFVAVVAPHKTFGNFLNLALFKGLPLELYNLYVLIAAITALGLYLLVFIINANKQADRKKLYAYLGCNILFAALIINILFVVNIETIHFPQYALLAILMFPLIGNYTGTMIWATLLGMVDEAYQYFYLAPKDTSYFDFNDVVTNLVGAVFGLLLLRSLNVRERTTFNLKKSTIWRGIGLLIAIVSIAHLMGVLSIYPNDGRPYHILREWPEGFWTEGLFLKGTIIFHIMRPLEGLAFTIGLWIFFSQLRSNIEEE